jgi:hypothetical protein
MTKLHLAISTNKIDETEKWPRFLNQSAVSLSYAA